jgi:hypothetical protein
VANTKDDAPNRLFTVGLSKLYFGQLRIMKGHIKNTVLTVVHKAIMGPKFNHRTLQKQLNWKDWLASEWIQLGNYVKQNVCGPPCTVPIDASIFFCVWLYSIKPHENDCKKVRGVCDGSTHGGQKMVHGVTYAPTLQQIDICLQIDLSALLGMYTWHTDFTNALAEAECPVQIYYMRCDCVFGYWWADKHPDTPFLQIWSFLFLRTSKAILKAHAYGQFIVIHNETFQWH